MNAIIIIALTAFTEARRNRVTVLVGAFTLVLILSTTVILDFAVFTLDRVATDFGLGVMSLLMVGLAIFLSSGHLSRDIERRTIFLVLSRPVSRSQFVIGRALGACLTLFVLQGAMALVFVAQLSMLNVPLVQSHAAALIGLSAELALLCALGTLLSSAAGPLVASVSTVGLYLVGHGAADLYAMGQTSKSPLIKVFASATYWVVPQLDRLDFKMQAAYATPVPWATVGIGVLYALGYAIVAMVLATVIFERIDFK